MSLTLAINGQSRTFTNLEPPVTLAQVIAILKLKGDRIAVEHNGEIAQRPLWAETPVASGDRLEVVHFVGGGTGAPGNLTTHGRTAARSTLASFSQFIARGCSTRRMTGKPAS